MRDFLNFTLLYTYSLLNCVDEKKGNYNNNEFNQIGHLLMYKFSDHQFEM